MVYCGKPSRGCSSCRKRRIKCDQKEPACSQCLRTKKECPGYRDLVALMFRDENAKVVSKARSPERISREFQERAVGFKKRQLVKPKDHSDASTICGSDSFDLMAWDPESFALALLSEETFCFPLVRSLSFFPREELFFFYEEQGIKFFLSHYTSSCMSSGPDRHLDILSSPPLRQLLTNKQVYDALSFVGLAGLSNVTKDQDATIITRQKYAEMLQQTATALKTLDTANTVHTFFAILILIVFEVVNSTPKSDDQWGIHVDGAVALMKTGGLKLSNKNLEFPLQLQFCFSIFISCLQRGKHFPESMAQWTTFFRTSQSPMYAHASALADHIIQFVNLCASIRDGSLDDPDSIFSQALILDAQLEEWVGQLPQHWNFTTVVDESRPAFQGKYHIYKAISMAHAWNHYRWVRIRNNELLLNYMVKVAYTPEHDIQRTKALNLITELATDICHSVSSESCGHTIENSNEKSMPRMSGIFMALWPLAVAGSAIGAPEDVYHWVIKLLENAGYQMGILQAVTLIAWTNKQRQRWMVNRLNA